MESMELQIALAITKKFDAVRRVTKGGVEYWTARDIQPLLGYAASWENFAGVVDKAKMACESAGVQSTKHFHDVMKMIKAGKGAIAERADCYLSRFACYLLAMSGDGRKPEIGEAKQYFAVQTRRQEISDEHAALSKRVAVRKRVSAAVLQLQDAAKEAGVQRHGLVHDARYRGLYGGRNASQIKQHKKIPASDDILDRAGHTELAANEFAITQAKDKIVENNVRSEQGVITTQWTVAEAVRATIKKIGGKMPEDLPPEPDIKKLVAGKPPQSLPGTEK
jgi:DNA-damage-inducible protein D